MEGMVCSPVIIEPTALRRILDCETAAPITTPITNATPYPKIARCSVMKVALTRLPSVSPRHSSWSTGTGPGSTYSGFQPLHTTSCQRNSEIATAATFGQVANQMRESSSVRGDPPSSSASSPAI
jgi:hypothetical protein